MRPNRSLGMEVVFEVILVAVWMTVSTVLGTNCACNQRPDNATCTATINNPYPQHAIIKARVEGRCVYALDHTVVYEVARAFCEDNGLRLVQFKDTCQQQAVFEVTDWMQHWIGLEKNGDGTWQWVDKNSMMNANIPSSRWENAPDADLPSHTRAYTMTTYNENKYHLKPVEVTASYRPVCEDFTCADGTDHARLHILVAMTTAFCVIQSALNMM